MSDDKTVTDVTEKKEEAKEPKTYEESYVKELIAERDKAKAKVREIAEKERAAAEAKAIEEGKLKDVLASKESELAEANKKLEAVEAVKQAQRKAALDRVSDPVLKKYAEKLTDGVEILQFIEDMEAKKLTTHNSNSPKEPPGPKKFKDFRSWDESFNESGGNPLIPKSMR